MDSLSRQKIGGYSLRQGKLVDILNRFRFDEQHVAAFDPSFSQIHPEPSFAVFFVEAQRGGFTEFFEIVLSPGFSHVRGVNETGVVGGCGAVMR